MGSRSSRTSACGRSSERARGGYALSAALLLAATGCQQELPPRFRVDELRILAIKAEPPEVAPGESSIVSALVADPAGAGRALDWVVALCTPDSSSGECLEYAAIAEVYPNEEVAASEYAKCCVRGNTSTPEDGRLEIGDRLFTSVVTLDSMLEGLDDRAALEGVNAQLTLVVCESGVCLSELEDPGEVSSSDDLALSLPPDQSSLAVKRIRVSSAPAGERNLNPELEAISLGDRTFQSGQSLTVAPGQTVEIAPLLAEGSIEDYTYLRSDGVEEARTEAPYFTWYVTAGELEANFTDLLSNDGSNLWTAPGLDGLLDPMVMLYIVVWDRRGGIDWFYLELEIEEG